MSIEVSELSFLPKQQGVLPFKTLVLAPLAGNQELLELPQPMSINLSNFDQVIKQVSPIVDIEIDNNKLCHYKGVETQTLIFSYSVSSYNDFLPESIIHREPSLSDMAAVIEQIQGKLQLDGMRFKGGDFQCGVIQIAELRQEYISRKELEVLVCDLESVLTDVLNQIIHQSDFQKLEAAWTGLRWLCQTTADSKVSLIDCVPCNRELLRDDLFSCSDVTDTQLYQSLFADSIGQYGAIPYGAMMLDDYFSGYGDDLNVLKQLSQLSSEAYVPLVTGTTASMFDTEQYPDIQNIASISDVHSGPKYIKWRSFLASEQASYLSLTLPRLLFRTSYNKQNQALRWFEEETGEDHEACLWGNASYAFITNLIRSFEQHGFCTFISGNEGGVLDVSAITQPGEYFPIEIAFSEQKEAELISLGFNPICTRQFTKQLVFQSANSVRWGAIKLLHLQQSADSIASAQLQYLFIVIRIIHCLKIIFRETVGNSTNSSELSTHLNRWLRQYVSDVESPTKQVRAERPLRDGKVDIQEGEVTGWYDVSIELVPHLKYLGTAVTITTSMPILNEGAA